MRYNHLLKDEGFVPKTDYTHTLSEYASNLRYEDIPPEVLHRAKMILLQTIGVSLGARPVSLAEKIRKLGVESNNGEGGPTTAWITGEKLSAAASALIAGTLADVLDWEDCSWTGHPSAGIIPVAWITAEEKGKSGKDVLTAIVAAYEVYQRIANAAQPSAEGLKKGWGLTSWQIFGTAVAAAKIYGLDARKTEQAIGLAAESSTIPACYHNTTMSDFYHYEHGYRARTGIIIAKAAEKGIHNQRDVLDTPRGYLEIISDDPDKSWLTRDLGKKYLILETLLKHWPANMWVQSPAEAAAIIVEKHHITPADIKEIIIDPGISDRWSVPDEGFDSITHAEFSTPFVVSALIHNPVPGAHWYSAENLKNPSVIDLAKRVKAGPSPAEGPAQGFAQFRKGEYPKKTVSVITKDGRTLTEAVDKHPGHPHNILTEDEFIERFRLQAAPSLQGARVDEAISAIINIEKQDNIKNIAQLLVAK